MSTSEPWLNQQVVLILCGLVGSGKSTFATQLQEHYPRFHRCNQDELGDRRQVERLARDCLARGLSVCIDRTNFDAAQRSYWIQIAREFSPQIPIWVIVFDTPYEVCAERLQTRTCHPTIENAEHGLYVLSRFAAQFERPNANEGLDHIISLKPKDTPLVYTPSEIAAILHRLHNSSPVSATNSTNFTESSHHTFWSFPGRQFRGRGYSARSYPSTTHQSGSGGRGVLPLGSVNNRLDSRPPNEITSIRGAGRTLGNSNHRSQSKTHWSDPSNTGGQVQVLPESVLPKHDGSDVLPMAHNYHV